jgi:hypothetical protein
MDLTAFTTASTCTSNVATSARCASRSCALLPGSVDYRAASRAGTDPGPDCAEAGGRAAQAFQIQPACRVVAGRSNRPMSARATSSIGVRSLSKPRLRTMHAARCVRRGYPRALLVMGTRLRRSTNSADFVHTIIPTDRSGSAAECGRQKAPSPLSTTPIVLNRISTSLAKLIRSA